MFHYHCKPRHRKNSTTSKIGGMRQRDTRLSCRFRNYKRMDRQESELSDRLVRPWRLSSSCAGTSPSSQINIKVISISTAPEYLSYHSYLSYQRHCQYNLDDDIWYKLHE